MSLSDLRRFFAEDVRVLADLKSPRLVRALEEVPRERFLGPGPWLIRGPYDSTSRQTDDADPRHVYHDLSIAIDPSRDLYNGQPSLLSRWIDALGITDGHRVLHIGCGTGYFTALIARVVGPTGQVVAVEVDEGLAVRARENLTDTPWASVRHGDGLAGLPSGMDSVLVNAGATHVPREWLDAVGDPGRLLVPLTATLPGMPPTIGKGLVMLARRAGDDWRAKMAWMIAIYSAVGARDEAMNAELGKAMAGGKWGAVASLRREMHEREETCWLHRSGACLSMPPPAT
jgi:protein-L-isoaspartate(D-aspartate) O-methyltransferase